MTIYAMYRCNLCTDFIKPTDSTAKEGFGVCYSSGRMEFKLPHECERHICFECARLVYDAVQSSMPMK